MSLLEVITKASSSIPTLPDEETDYPIVLNPESVLLGLKPESDGPQTENPVKKVTGWEISQTDHELIELGQKFFKKLRRNLKNTNSFGKAEFLEMVTSHLENIANKAGVSVASERTENEVCKLVEKSGALMGREVKGLILEGCISLEVWDVLQSLIVNGVVEHAFTSTLVQKLIEKRKSDLIVLCLKYLLDLQAYDLMCILKYFLMPSSDGYKSMVSVREDWERQAKLAIEKASGKGVGGKEQRRLAKEAALLIMLGHDGFSVSELCLHYLFASSNLDEVIFAACASKLNVDELKALIKYLGKWLRKYERFPQVAPLPKGSSSVLSLEVCDWIPSLDNVVKYLGVVVDEHFSSLVLHSQFHELRSLEEVISSLTADARLCGTMANLAERLRIERQAYHHDSLGNFAF